MSVPPELRQKLAKYQQTHVLRWWDELDSAGQRRLLGQLAEVDFEQLTQLAGKSTDAGDSPRELALRAVPPRDLVRLADLRTETVRLEKATATGNDMLSRGKVAALVVAGGQGTRLGFPHAKGLFPIGPVSGAPLLSFLCGQIRAREERAQRQIPYYVMTSDATHDELVAAFAQHGNFGLSSDQVVFFKQGNMPAVSAENGSLLMSSKDSLALSPDGHGGLVAAMDRGGVFADLQRRGIETLFYHQVDNPCAILCDPVFLGLHRETGSELSTKVVAKRDAADKMGVLVDVDGRTQIIEYSDMPAEVTQQREADGSLRFWAGNTAIHVIEVDFLHRLAEQPASLPFHRARKKVPYLNEHGILIEPPAENALKFERFIFDALPVASRALVVEAERSREFNPVKNASGNDSPETCREALQSIWKGWLDDAGVRFPADAKVEISFEIALGADDLRRIWPQGKHFASTQVFLTR